jgi:hypothetical protein
MLSVIIIQLSALLTAVAGLLWYHSGVIRGDLYAYLPNPDQYHTHSVTVLHPNK